MRATSKLLALALAAALQPAVADVVTLNFEDITLAADPAKTGIVELLNRYSGSGVEFTGAAWGLVAGGSCGGIGNFIPHNSGTCAGLYLAGDPRDAIVGGEQSFTLNFAAGFIAGSSLYYSALASSEATVTLYDGLNGSGNAIFPDDLNYRNCDKARFCNWQLLSLDFTGIARSLVVSGIDEQVMIDDVTLVKADTAPGRLPEPGGIALAVAAFGAMGWARKRVAR